MIKRIFRGEILTNFATALVSILTLQVRLSDQVSAFGFQQRTKPARLKAACRKLKAWLFFLAFQSCFLVAGMPVKSPGRGELAKLMSHHILCHKNGQKFPAVVDRKCQADKLRKDG
jgi:hypothetical protein